MMISPQRETLQGGCAARCWQEESETEMRLKGQCKRCGNKINGSGKKYCLSCRRIVEMERENVDRKNRGFSFQKIKKHIVSETGSVCSKCGSLEKIEAHHINPIKNGGDNSRENLILLCHDCHKKEHHKR